MAINIFNKPWAVHLWECSKNLFTTRFLITLACLFVILPETIFQMPMNGLDASYQIAINMLIDRGIRSGSEFAFAYGPLGFLETGQWILIPVIYQIIYHAFLIACLGFLFYHNLGTIHKLHHQILYLPGILLFASNIYIDKSFLMLILFIFFIFHHQKENHLGSLAVAAIISWVSFFVKMNTGLVISLLISLYFIYLLIDKRVGWKHTVALILIHLSVLIILSILLNVDLPMYIKSGISTISDYNDAVQIPSPLNFLLMATGIIVVLFILIILNIRSIIGDRSKWILYGFILIATYLRFKHGFVRADEHVYGFFAIAPFMFSFIFFFEDGAPAKRRSMVAVIAAGILSSMALYLTLPGFNFEKSAKATLLKVPLSDILNQNIQFDNFRIFYKSGLEKCRIPDNIKQIIRNKTVDIIPFDIACLYYNNLNYEPRPAIQTFSAYNEFLDNLNAEKYSSPTAPEFLIFQNLKMNSRYPFWDESKTRLQMLLNYEYAESFQIYRKINKKELVRRYLLLRKRTENKHAFVVKRWQVDYRLGDTLEIPKSRNLIYMRTDFRYDLFGEIRRFLYQPGIIRVYLEAENSVPIGIFRAVKPILNGEVLINKNVSDLTDARTFFLTCGRENASVTRVVFLPGVKGLRKDIRITFSEIEIN